MVKVVDGGSFRCRAVHILCPGSLLRFWNYINHLLTFLLTYSGKGGGWRILLLLRCDLRRRHATASKDANNDTKEERDDIEFINRENGNKGDVAELTRSSWYVNDIEEEPELGKSAFDWQ